MKPVNSNLIKVGTRLPWSVYSKEGVLLLRAGYVIHSPQLLDSLLEHGLYVQEEVRQAPKPRPPSEWQRQADPFEMLDHVETVLARLLQRPLDRHASDAFLRLATRVQEICDRDADVAIASIMLDSPSKYSIRHMIDVAIITEVTLLALGVSPENRLSAVAAALTSNLSMLELQDVLFHREGRVTASEQQQIHRHPEESHAALARAGITDPIWLEAVLHHHETLDGQGYPFGLGSDRIGLASRALGIGDIFCAMMRPRGYRPGILPRQAMARILQTGKDKYDGEILEYMVKQVGIYPPGTVVLLESGETAVIIRRNTALLAPLAMVIIDARGSRVVVPIKRNTAISGYRIRKVTFLRDADFKISRAQVWGYG